MRNILKHQRRSIKLILCLLTVAFFFIIGCDRDDPSDVLWSGTASTNFGRIPRWSPDGNRLLFGDDRAESHSLWIWKPGEEPHLLADSLPDHNWDYHWSHDGAMVGFTSPGDPDSPTSGSWIVSMEDRSRHRIHNRGRDLSWFYNSQAAAVRIDQPVQGLPGIYLVDIESGQTEYIAGGYTPVCSPVDSAIAFHESEINGRLILIDSDFTPSIISENGVLHAVWSGDGSKIFYALNDYTSGEMRWDVFQVAQDGSGWTSEELASWAIFPAPDRDGSSVVFQRISSAKWRGIWLWSDWEESRIADYGLNPDYHPHEDKIAINAADGGILVLEKD